MDTAQGLVMDAGFNEYQQLQEQLQQMSQAEIDTMNSVLSQFQMPASISGLEGEMFEQAQQQHTQYLQTIYLQQVRLQNEEMRQIAEAVARNREQQRAQTSASSPSHPQSQLQPQLQPQSHPLVHLQQPFPHDAPPLGATPQQLQQLQMHYDLQHQSHQGQQPPPPPPSSSQQRTPPVTWPQGSAGVSAASIPIGNDTAVVQGRPSRGRSHARLASSSASASSSAQPPTVEPAAATAAPAQAPAPVDAPTSNSNNGDNTTTTEDDEHLLRLQDLSIMHRPEGESVASASSMTSSASTATITGPTRSSVSPSRPPAPQLLYLPSNPPLSSPSHSSQIQSLPQPQHLQHSALPPHPLHSAHLMHNPPQQPLPNSQPVHPYPNHQASASASCSSLDNFPLPPSHQPTLSPRKQRTASSSPKKTGRFESIYATLRNRASNMRRSRTAFMHEVAQPTVAPMATLNDASMPETMNKSHHAHHRSHHSGDLDLDLDLPATMGSYPPTPPLTGTASSMSSTSSQFSTSACSSVASSVGDGPQFHHLVAAQFPHHSLHNHHSLVQHHPNLSEDELTPAEMAHFVSGVVDDPFADTNAFFGGGGAPGPQSHPQHALLALRPHVKTEYPPQPQSQPQPPSSGVSSACWPTTVSTPSGKASPQHLQDDNDATPVTAAINIPSRVNADGLAVSPSAYLANAAANMSGSSVIASASAAAALAAAAANVKHDPDAAPMDTDEDWWQQSVVESAVGDPLEQSIKAGEADALYTTSVPPGYQPEYMATNGQAFDANGNLCYYMPDMATNGLMIHMPQSGTTTPGSQQNQYYFPGITSAGTGFPPPPPIPASEHEQRDHRNGGSRRPKPRAPSAGARYHNSRGDGLHSPRKRSSVNNLPKTHDDGSGISAAAMTAPSTPRGHQLGRRSHSMQALPRTSPTPAGGSFSSVPSGATTPNGAIRKRRSASNMRRVSSTQGITSLTAAAAIATAVGASTSEPKTPSRRQRSTSVEAHRPQSSSSNGGEASGFVNFTMEDHDTLMNGVAPSGSSKTKARRERELQEKTRKFSERLVRAMAEAGGTPDAAMRKLEAEGLKDIGAIAL